jgi:hypothetical protein
MDNKKKIENEDQEIELVNIEDLRTAFGGEDLGGQPDTNQVNRPTTMCGGWN